MRSGTTFSGIGGFELAFERAGIDVAWSCEIDEHCNGVLTRHWPNVPHYTDITTLRGSDIEKVDCLVGGFPCQDLSVAGRRAGLEGSRSGLFFEFVRVAREVKPRWVILENVPGLLSSDVGRDMGTVIATLGELGYSLAWRVLDAQYFGVPQRRRRVFIVGYLGDWRYPAEVLFEREGMRGNPPTRGEAGPSVAALTANGVGTCGADDNQGQAGNLIARTLTTSNTRIDAETETFCVTGTVTHTLTSEVQAKPETAAGLPIVPRSAGVRRLTPTECERLQGFPDGWTDGQSDAQRYRQLGNAVAVPVVEWIARRLVAVDREEDGYQVAA